MSRARGRWSVVLLMVLFLAALLLPSALLAADNNAKLIADGKEKLTAFREAEKKKMVDDKEAEIAAVKAGEIDANLKMTFIVSPAGKWKFQQEGHQLSELNRRTKELQKIQDSAMPTNAPALNFFTMKKGDVGRLELILPQTSRLTELKTSPAGKEGLLVTGNLEQWAPKGWRPANTQRSFQVQEIDPTEDYAKGVYVFVGTLKVKGTSVPRLICIERPATAK